jgi:hypothetical protein
MTFLWRATSTRWSVLATSNAKAWIGLEAKVPMLDVVELGWVQPGMRERARRTEKAHLEAEEAARPAPGFTAWYAEAMDWFVGRGAGIQEAHRKVAWASGAQWVRQEGDNNHYGTGGCVACSADGPCRLCRYAADRGTTCARLLSTDWGWAHGKMAEGWGNSAWETRRMVRFGALPCYMDPERVEGAARKGATDWMEAEGSGEDGATCGEGSDAEDGSQGTEGGAGSAEAGLSAGTEQEDASTDNESVTGDADADAEGGNWAMVEVPKKVVRNEDDFISVD